MTADEIRSMEIGTDTHGISMQREIAAQFAELNETLRSLDAKLNHEPLATLLAELNAKLGRVINRTDEHAAYAIATRKV